MNLIMPLILLISSIIIFFGYVNPNYKGGVPSDPSDYPTYSVVALQNELGNYQDIADRSTDIVAQRNVLVNKKNSITETDQAKIETFLPSNIDNIRLLIEINRMAARRSLVLKNISFSQPKATDSAVNLPYGVLSLKFTVNSTYANFLQFLGDLESNLRILDITDIGFTSTDSGLYDFNVGLNTYWLK